MEHLARVAHKRNVAVAAAVAEPVWTGQSRPAHLVVDEVRSEHEPFYCFFRKLLVFFRFVSQALRKTAIRVKDSG